MWRRRRRQADFTLIIVLVAVPSMLIWHIAGGQTKDELNRIPPSIYQWIEENAHICTIVPSNGENLVNFLSVDEGAKCALCPELGTREVPSMACAVEVSPNDIDVEIGCHPVPELCVLELKTRYAEFYSGLVVGLPPGPPGPPGSAQQHRTRSEEEIFQATGSIFAPGSGDREAGESLMELMAMEKGEEKNTEEEEEHHERTSEESKEDEKEEFSISEEEDEETPTTTSSTTTTTTTPSTTTTVRANVFARPRPQAFPVNLTMEERRLLSRTSISLQGSGPSAPPSKQSKGRKMTSEEEEEPVPIVIKSPAGTDALMMKKRGKGGGGGGGGEADEVDAQEMAQAVAPCRDQHELCCFWAMSGECDSNPFWMRTKCPMTCGTCGCKIRNADKCRSVGVKCMLPTTTTTTTTTTTPTTSTTTRRTTTTTSTTPSPPPTLITRRPRPTPPVQMPGHRPQRPRQRTRTTTPTTTTTTTEVTTYDDDEEPFDKSNMVEDSGGGDGGSGGGGDERTTVVGIVISGHSGKNAGAERILPTAQRIDGETEEAERRVHKTWHPKISSDAGEPGYKPELSDESHESQFATSSTVKPETTPTTIAREMCFNFHKLCDFWAKMGECLNNPFWMRPHCQISCKSCGETLGDISTPPSRQGCNNEHILCPFWAFIGECARNPRWMGLNCRGSCQLC